MSDLSKWTVIPAAARALDQAVTGKPILYVGMGKPSDLEQFYPPMAGRILEWEMSSL